MKRALTLVAAVALTAIAVALPPPEEEIPTLAGLIVDPPGIESPADASIWYCPWAQSSAERDSEIGIVSLAPAEAGLTFPVAIPGEPADSASAATLGPGAAVVTLSEVAQRGDSPGFIEFDDGPAAAAVAIHGDVLAADACVATGPDEWFFAGGSTGNGESLRLRLFNPFPETAKVTVTGFSEIGIEALGELRSVTVNARSWRDIDFEESLRQRETLVISVRADEGLVVPAMSLGTETDEAWWMGTGLSETWELPVARTPDVASSIVVANPGLTDVEVTVDLFTADESLPGAFTVTVPAESPLRIELGDVASPVVGARVSATGPVAVAVAATGEGGAAVSAGVPSTGRTWLVPGARTRGLQAGTIWLLNSSDEPTTATVAPLSDGNEVNTSHVLEPGRLTLVAITGEDSLGFVVSAPDPITVGWSLELPGKVAYAPALLVPDE